VSSATASGQQSQVSNTMVSTPKIKVHNKYSALQVSGEGLATQDELF
jgi:hypothetical protein